MCTIQSVSGPSPVAGLKLLQPFFAALHAVAAILQAFLPQLSLHHTARNRARAALSHQEGGHHLNRARKHGVFWQGKLLHPLGKAQL